MKKDNRESRDLYIVHLAYQLRIQGLTWLNVKKELIRRFSSDKELAQLEYIIAKAKRAISSILIEGPVNLPLVHAERYEFLYNRFIEYGFDKYALKALSNIQRIAGIHSMVGASLVEEFVNNSKTVQVNDYKWNALDDKQKGRFLYLLRKTGAEFDESVFLK